MTKSYAAQLYKDNLIEWAQHINALPGGKNPALDYFDRLLPSNTQKWHPYSHAYETRR